MSDDKASLISPDPKIRISSTGSAGPFTFQYAPGTNGSPNLWRYSTDGGRSWTNYDGTAIEVKAEASVTVQDETGHYSHADLAGEQDVANSGRQELKSGQATFTIGTVNGVAYHVVLDAIATPVGSYASGWYHDSNSVDHVKQIPHSLGHVPNKLLVWFASTTAGMQYPVIWNWGSHSGNPVSIFADNNNVYLSVTKESSLHGVWPRITNEPPNPPTYKYEWQSYTTGYWRIVVS